MSPRPKLITPQGDLQQAIIKTAWEQIAERGAPALSLRAIARALKITAPAIYNYFPDRDALVTALIVEAFTSFGNTQQQAIAQIPQSEHAQRLRALGLAYRQWAVTYPERYQLIFGTPIAGYSAPMEITMPAAARSLAVLVKVLDDTHKADRLQVDESLKMTPKTESMLKEWQASRAPDVHIEALFLALTIWGCVHGLVSLEVGNQFPPFISDAGEIYRRELERIVMRTIKT
jgi:AcrR family transcriptional regulator